MSVHELALQRNKYKHLSDDEWRWFLQQAEGRERTADKLPTFAAIEDWWYPVRLSCEQCSSELTAKYKAQIGKCANEKIGKCLDLTGGYGVDTYFLSEHFNRTDYVEQNAELCRIAEHNLKRPTPSLPKGKEICVHNTSAEHFLSSLLGEVGRGFDLIYIDPARRDSHGGKVFRLEDCTPNVVELLPALLQHLAPEGRLMLKLSPMLDITQALNALTVSDSLLVFDVHVVAVKNEVKEILLLSQPPTANSQSPTITAIDLAEPEKTFIFTREQEKEAQVPTGKCENEQMGKYLYEPNAAILKAGSYKLVAQRFGLAKADINTHLYFSDRLIDHFPGRVWQLNEKIGKCENEKMRKCCLANVLARNYPLTAEQLKKKMHIKDGGEGYLIGCRVQGKPTLFHATRIY